MMLCHNYTILNLLGFKVEPWSSKKLLNFILQKYRFPKYAWTIYIHQLLVLPLNCDSMGNSTHVQVHVQARSTKTR